MSIANEAVEPLGNSVRRCVSRYLKDLNGEPATDLYSMVLTEIEKPLLEVVMKKTNQNQTQAAMLLGINRNTLRDKLNLYDLL